MTANELRIGNLVTAKSPERQEWESPVVVTIGYLEMFTTDKVHFKPLPLTEEWLLQFGFEKQHKELSHLSPLNLPETFNLPNSPFSYSQGKLILTTGTGDFCVYIEYVHQLQNLYFALTGEELTFKSE